MHQIGVVETHLNFRRMHVDVIIGVRHLDEQKDDGEPVRLQKPAICLFDRVRDEFVANEPAVEKYILKSAVHPRYARFAQQSPDVQSLFVTFGLDQIIGASE